MDIDGQVVVAGVDDQSFEAHMIASVRWAHRLEAKIWITRSLLGRAVAQSLR